LQQKKIQGLKQKNCELTGTKMMIKPLNSNKVFIAIRTTI
jgi:hypothetical protein